MTNKIMQLNIVSAEGEVYSGDVLSLVISGDRGDLGIYTGHSALITSMKPGQVIAKDEKGEDDWDWVTNIFKEEKVSEDVVKNFDSIYDADIVKEETQKLFDELEPFGILEFVRSGRVAITKPMRTLTSIVNELENT